jgi:hypothetical protein
MFDHGDLSMQQVFVTAIKENNTEQFKELLNTATEIEKENAALLAAFTNKIERLRELIVCGVNINRADKDGRTCLHWAVYHNNRVMIKLLLGFGAENKADMRGETPADYAENEDYTEAFNLLVQHFFIEPFKPRQQAGSEADEIILKEVKAEPPKISAKTLKLLMQYHIKKSDMDLVGIDIEDIEDAVTPSFCISFIGENRHYF